MRGFEIKVFGCLKSWMDLDQIQIHCQSSNVATSNVAASANATCASDFTLMQSSNVAASANATCALGVTLMQPKLHHNVVDNAAATEQPKLHHNAVDNAAATKHQCASDQARVFDDVAKLKRINSCIDLSKLQDRDVA